MKKYTWDHLIVLHIRDIFMHYPIGDKYIAKTILSASMEKREKLTILLAHMEPLIYETLEIINTRENIVGGFELNCLTIG